MRRTDGRVTVDVTDDGVGGADVDARLGPARPGRPRRGARRDAVAGEPGRRRDAPARGDPLSSAGVSGAARRLLPHRGKGASGAESRRTSRAFATPAPGARSNVGCHVGRVDRRSTRRSQRVAKRADGTRGARLDRARRTAGRPPAVLVPRLVAARERALREARCVPGRSRSSRAPFRQCSAARGRTARWRRHAASRVALRACFTTPRAGRPVERRSPVDGEDRQRLRRLPRPLRDTRDCTPKTHALEDDDPRRDRRHCPSPSVPVRRGHAASSRAKSHSNNTGRDDSRPPARAYVACAAALSASARTHMS